MATSGIIFDQDSAEELAASPSLALVNVLQVTPIGSLVVNGPYRPSTWQNGVTQYSIVIPSSGQTSQNPTTGTIQTIATETTAYVFDAIWRANHELALNLTKKPVQTGFNISDNAIQVQPVITLEIGMNDTMDSFQAGMWSGNPSKSVSAFLTMQTLLQNRQFLTLNTRLQSYQNVMLTKISAPEDAKTQYGLRLLLTFEQVFVSTVASQTVSARPQATNNTQLGTLQPSTVPSPATTNFELPSSINVGANVDNFTNQFGTVANAGAWSSNPTATINNTLSAVNP